MRLVSIASRYKALLLLANCVDAALGPLLANVPHVHRLGLRGLSGSSTGLKRRWRRWISQASGCASDTPVGNCHIGPERHYATSKLVGWRNPKVKKQ